MTTLLPTPSGLSFLAIKGGLGPLVSGTAPDTAWPRRGPGEGAVGACGSTVPLGMRLSWPPGQQEEQV